MLCYYGNWLQIDADMNVGYGQWDQEGTLSKSWLFRMKYWNRLITFLSFRQMFAQTAATFSSTSDLSSGCQKVQFLHSYTERLISHFRKWEQRRNLVIAVYSFSPQDINALAERWECDNSIWHFLFLVNSFLKHKRNESRNISFYDICQMSDNHILCLYPSDGW